MNRRLSLFMAAAAAVNAGCSSCAGFAHGHLGDLSDGGTVSNMDGGTASAADGGSSIAEGSWPYSRQTGN